MSSAELAERLLVMAALDRRDASIEQARDDLHADVERLRQSWSTGYAEELEASQARMAQMRAQTDQYIKDLTGAADDEPAPAQDVGQGHGASATGPAPAPGPGPGQPNNPYAAELERARELKNMPLVEYAARRAELGVQSATSMDRLFGETR